MAVTGVVHPKKVLTNAGGKAGDILVLTKPIGTGIATTALKRELASKELVKRVTTQMATLNKAAGEVFASGKFKVNALTDVTGFGLLGHVLEVARGAKLRAVIELERVPLLSEIAELAAQGVVPGGTKTNLAHAEKGTTFPDGLPDAIKFVLADAQTNGGLLAAIPQKDLKKAFAALEKKGVEAWAIGGLTKGKGVVVQ
jgi:selenide,water dikinase